jgi:DNA-binding transcriptional ArsR family regulator
MKVIFNFPNVSGNIFVMSNISNPAPDETLSRIFRALSSPVRLRILAAIGAGEACVCHLESLLDLRQAYISQQLMDMRQAGLLQTRREGRFIYYSLSEPNLLGLLIEIGSTMSLPMEEIQALAHSEQLPNCPCPHCSAHFSQTIISEMGALKCCRKEPPDGV